LVEYYTALHQCAARRFGHQHRRDYTGESSTNAVLRRIGIEHRRGGRRTREEWLTGTGSASKFAWTLPSLCGDKIE